MAIVTYYAIRQISGILLMYLEATIRRQESGEGKVKQMGGVILIMNILV